MSPTCNVIVVNEEDRGLSGLRKLYVLCQSFIQKIILIFSDP
jgi:hypothetical protein